MIGRTISHYQITAKIGEGGMGVVYKATDTTLKRTVALKFLSPQLLADETEKRRFLHEAQAAAALNHPHICTVHGIEETDGHTFMVLEYIDGVSLRDKMASGPLALDDALEITTDVARGLATAHAQGIVHRDIKPGNVLMAAHGDAKIVDFGLAKLGTHTRLTKTGHTVGTVAYMSPEQAQGGAVDHRTDVWSLGVMLYEMLAGTLPFRGDVDPAVIYSIINADPEPLTNTRRDVPVALEEIIEKALAKDPEKRYASVDAFLADLEAQRDKLALGIKERRWTSVRRLRRRRRVLYGGVTALVAAGATVAAVLFYGSSQAIDSIAVLPVANVSGDPEQESVADGMTIELITKLGKTGAFKKVVSWTSVRQYKEHPKPVPEIARELGVRAVVEGSMMTTGGNVQMTARLIEARTESPLWGESYEREFKNVLALYNDVTRAIVGQIAAKLTPAGEATLASARPVDPEAYEFYLRGKTLSVFLRYQDFEKAKSYLERAIEIDSTFAPAYAALAATYADAAIPYFKGPEILAQTREAVMKALQLDASLAEGHMALGMFRYIFEWDWEGAEEAFRHALELDPTSALVHAEYGSYLSFMARFDDALGECRRAIYLAPLDQRFHQYYAFTLYKARRWDESIAHFHKLLDLIAEGPNPKLEQFVHQELSVLYIEKGMFEEALAELEAANELFHRRGGEGDCCDWERARVYVRWGKRDQVEDLIAEQLSHPNVIPWTAAMLGDTELAFRRLEEMYAEHNTFMLFLKMSPELDNLRSDPRFDDLLRRMNFPD